MSNKINEKMHLFSWVKKGIGCKITEVDQLCKGGAQKHRPSIKLTMQLKSTAVQSIEGRSDDYTSTEVKDFSVIGPGDVLNINSNAVMNFYPGSGNNGISTEYRPYIEFWEPDFAWRYTPAKATAGEGDENGKLRPWLAVIACEKSKYSISKNSNGVDLVTFNVGKKDYANLFPNPEDIWKSAHAQGDDASEADFCRIVCVNEEDFKPNTEYTAFVIPVFEITRLRALGFDDTDDKLKDTLVQAPAWEMLYDDQNSKPSPLTFPAFFKWDFKTHEESFQTLVDSLIPFSTETSGINVDVTKLGDGLTIQDHDPILMPAATQTPTYRPEPAFPRANVHGDEAKLFDNLKGLLDLNPVFQENKKLIAGSSYKREYDKTGNDDPWVVPPIYGGKHAMATGFNDSNLPWLDQVNLDLHYRAVAGLGKKIVQEHQEQFVNRAWKQVEIVKALNTKIYTQLLSNKVGKSLKNRTFKKLFRSGFNRGEKGYQGDKESRSEFIKNLMLNLQSMMATGDGNLSINQILKNRGIPKSFAATSFQSRTQQLASKVDDLDLSSLMESIAENSTFKLSEPKAFNYYSLGQLRFFVFQTLLHSRFFVSKLAKGEQCNHGERSNKNGMSEWKFFDFLSIHKKAPQYINWNCVGFPELKSVVNHIYSFKRKPIEFASYDQYKCAVEHSFAPERLVVESRKEFMNRFLRDIGMIHVLVDGIGIDYSDMFKCSPIVWNYGLNKKVWNAYEKIEKTPSYGFVCNEDNCQCIKIGNVIGLSKNDYIALLGNGKIITPISVANEIIYFINKDDVLELARKNELSCYIILGAVVGGKFKNINYNKIVIDLSNGNDRTTLKLDLSPDIINIRAEAFSDPEFVKEYVNESIDGVYDFVERYVNNHKSSGDMTIQAYLDCMDILKNAECQYGEKARNQSDVTDNAKNGELTEIITAVEEKTEETINKSTEFVKTYNNRYMSVFLNDPKLQESFARDCLNSKYPIMAYPQFPEPTYFYLKQLSDKFILPCVDELPNNSVSMFYSNEAFVESFLCGMNTEMGRELLWREYPTDQRGSYFKKFWDTETSIQDIQKENYFDIKSLHTWKDKLGKNKNESKSQLLMFVVKGNLMKNYPDTQIYLNKAKIGQKKDGTFEFQLMEGSENDVIVRPAAQAFFRDDIYVVGFPISIPQAIGKPSDDPLKNTNCGYMLVFKQMMENLDFRYCGLENFKNSVQYAYNPDDEKCLKQAIVMPYMSAKHVITYVEN